MILVNGNILASEEINNILPVLEKMVCKTLQKPPLDPMTVVEACHKLAEQFEQGAYQNILNQLVKEEHITTAQIHEVTCMFHRDSLLYKLKQELGENLDDTKPELGEALDNKKLELGEALVDTKPEPPFYEKREIRRRRMPLGVLFHIAAGNVDGLPAYSMIEGLLAGNINILKLPSTDHGFTLRLLSELIKATPALSEYIYVFDTSSNDIQAMKAMARCANAVVVWGGDNAIDSVRRLATPNTKLIEWGHKMSFAYVTEFGITEKALTGLAHHILSTRQLLCSSCQGVFIDSDNIADVYTFCEQFIIILEDAARSYPKPGIGMEAQLSLLLYNQELEAVQDGRKIYRGGNCSLIASGDKKLEVSFTYGNCWVKLLPSKSIINRLHRYKGYLQTVGLLCGEEERDELSDLLLRAGATRITDGSDMSRMLCGEAHDGEYPLQRYSRIVEY